ncbi:hypothetical protein AX16_005062 [Volvariella volvacea WC 439]|nr:hypothetical protein AX16_005062 [Volvariella volvacea WC 439]
MRQRHLEEELDSLEAQLLEFEEVVKQRRLKDESFRRDLEQQVIKAEDSLNKDNTENETLMRWIEMWNWDTEIHKKWFISQSIYSIEELVSVVGKLNAQTTMTPFCITNVYDTIPPTLTQEAQREAGFTSLKILPPDLLVYLQSSHDHPQYTGWLGVALQAIWTWCHCVHIECWSLTNQELDGFLRNIFANFRGSDSSSAHTWKKATLPLADNVFRWNDPALFVANLWEATRSLLAFCGWDMELLLRHNPDLRSQLVDSLQDIVETTLLVRTILAAGVKGPTFFCVEWFEAETPFDKTKMERDPLLSIASNGPIICTLGLGLLIDCNIVMPHVPRPSVAKGLEPPVIVGEWEEFLKKSAT